MAKFLGLPPALSGYASEPIWLLWKAEFRPAQNKWTKVPYCAQDPSRKAATNDPATWATFDRAQAALAGGHGDGIGLALRDTELGAFDLDHCRDPRTATCSPRRATWSIRPTAIPRSRPATLACASSCGQAVRSCTGASLSLIAMAW